MSDSNEMKNDQKHPRLRLPQAGVKAQQEYDAGEPLTTDGYVARMNHAMLDFMNGLISREDAQTYVAMGNSMIKAKALDLKNKELTLQYAYKHEQAIEAPEPLQLVAGRKNGKAKK